MLRFINFNKRTVWNMEFGMEIGIQHYWNTVCKLCRCFDLSLSLWRLFVDGKMLGVLKLSFFTETFATKRLFCSDSTRVLCLCKRFFGSSLKKYSERWTQMTESIISTPRIWFVARVSVLLRIGSVIEGASYSARDAVIRQPAARSVTQVTAALTIHDATRNKACFPGLWNLATSCLTDTLSIMKTRYNLRNSLWT